MVSSDSPGLPAPLIVVVVDDDPIVLDVMSLVLPAPEFEVHTFEAAEEALQRLGEIRPDLVISDLRMPGMDGVAFAGEVRRLAGMADVPLILLSGADEPAEVARSLDAGVDDYLIKPVDPANLRAKVRAMLRLSQRMAARGRQLSGSLADLGGLGLLKFFEEKRISGRLGIEDAGGRRMRFAFRSGELVGGDGLEPGTEPLDALLGASEGSYVIEPEALDHGELRRLASAPRALEPAATREVAQRAVLVPAGRLAKLDFHGLAVEVQTEAENRPHFIVTSVVVGGGRVLEKIETPWPYPLRRVEDEAPARKDIDRQHERVVALLRELAFPGDVTEVGGRMLGGALWLVADAVGRRIGSARVLELLRRTRDAIATRHPVVARFEAHDDLRVTGGPEGGTDVAELVAGFARWTADLMDHAVTCDAAVAEINLSDTTRLLAHYLERIGFYPALEAALDTPPHDPSG